MSVLDRLAVWPQYLLPKRGLSRLVHRLTRLEAGPLKNAMIRVFSRLYGVDLAEAALRRAEDYPSFNAFFTRALAPGARPLPPDPAIIVSPADGTLCAIGRVTGHTAIQAKGRSYSLGALLAGDPASYLDGLAATIYLAPSNYHRVHAPLAGHVLEVTYVPGTLFSVNARTAQVVDALFARNERVVLSCEGERGPFALVLVGALCVGSMEITSCDLLALLATHGRQAPLRHRLAEPFAFERGAELGRFNMGSTVILLLPHAAGTWRDGLEAGVALRMGDALGRLAGR